jgi:hypothetical protein
MNYSNIHPLTFTTSAVAVSYLLIEELNVNEQGAIGAWFNVVGDILSASSAWEGLQQSQLDTNDSHDDIESLKKSIDKIQKIIDSHFNHKEDV